MQRRSRLGELNNQFIKRKQPTSKYKLEKMPNTKASNSGSNRTSEFICFTFVYVSYHVRTVCHISRSLCYQSWMSFAVLHKSAEYSLKVCMQNTR